MRRYSLLHATYRAGAAAVSVRDLWMSEAYAPDRVEHIFAFDVDDDVSSGCDEMEGGVVGVSSPDVTAVRNWNAAAQVAQGELLVVIADDLYPCTHWDRLLDRVILDLDPRQVPFVIKVHDSADADLLIRHPVISRRYFERFGLWCPEYRGYSVDVDFTWSAFHHGLVIDGRSVRFQHDHPVNGRLDASESQRRIGAATSDEGRRLFEARWPLWRRRFIRRFFVPQPGQQVVPDWHRRLRVARGKAGYLKGLVPSAARDRLRAIAHVSQRPGV